MPDASSIATGAKRTALVTAGGRALLKVDVHADRILKGHDGYNMPCSTCLLHNRIHERSQRAPHSPMTGDMLPVMSTTNDVHR